MITNSVNTMNLINEWIETARGVLTDPAGFFESESRKDGFGYPLKFAAISIVLSAILGTLATGIRATINAGLNPVQLVSTLFGTLIGGLIGLFIGAAIIHIFVYLFGGKSGYKSTLAVVCYATAVSPISAAVSVIPILGGLAALALAIYAIYIQIKGVEEFQSLSTGQAALSVVLPYVIIGIIAVILAFLALAVFLSASQIGAGTIPVQ